MKNATTTSTVANFADSIVVLQKAKGYTGSEAYTYMSGYLMSHLSTVIDKLPKAKREALLAEMNAIAHEKMEAALSISSKETV
jgi:hypothetical protein